MYWAIKFVFDNIKVVDSDAEVSVDFLTTVMFDEVLDRIEIFLTEDQMNSISEMKNNSDIDLYLQENVKDYKRVLDDLVTDILTDYLV